MAPIKLSEFVLFAALIISAALVKRPVTPGSGSFAQTAARLRSFLVSELKKQPSADLLKHFGA